MAPKRLQTKPGDLATARARFRVAEKYLEAARLMELDEDRTAVNVCIGVAVLAGIAASDAICMAAIGQRYSGQDHAAAASLLRSVDASLGTRFRHLISLKPGSHYGERLLTTKNQSSALRDADSLVDGARRRLS